MPLQGMSQFGHQNLGPQGVPVAPSGPRGPKGPQDPPIFLPYSPSRVNRHLLTHEKNCSRTYSSSWANRVLFPFVGLSPRSCGIAILDVCVGGTGKPQCGVGVVREPPARHPGLCVSHTDTLCVSHTDTVSVPQREYLIILQREYLIIIQREYLIILQREYLIILQRGYLIIIQRKSELAGSGTPTHPPWDKILTKWV